MATTRVVIVGAGLGGLAAAARLARKGYQVRVVEKENVPGGRCGRLEVGGSTETDARTRTAGASDAPDAQAEGARFTWDIGPTVLLLPEVLRDTFRDCGADVRSFLELIPCDPNMRLHFSDGSALTTSSNLRSMQNELERFAPGSFPGFMRFLEFGRQQKGIALDTFLARTFDRPWSMLSPEAMRGVVKSRSYRTLYAVISEMISDPRLRVALTFQTMYLGLSPFEAPALFGLLPYTELVDGVWYVRGGLASVSEALASLATSAGARFKFGRAVRSIETTPGGVEGRRGGARARAIVMEDGERIDADVVLCNADLPYVYRALLGRPLRRPLRYTSSGFMMFWGCDRTFDGLTHHNAFFGSAYQASFSEIFEQHRIPADPSFYVANPVVTDPGVAPSGKSALYVLVPVPRLSPTAPDFRDEQVGRGIRAKVIERLERSVAPGLETSILVERRMTPLDWQQRFSLEHGSAFGLSHTLTQVAGLRPPNRDPELENLYFVGASTQPATGIPNVLLGAKHVAERIAKECP